MQRAGQHVPIPRRRSGKCTHQVVDNMAKYLEGSAESHEIYLDPYEGVLVLKQCNLQLSLQRTPVFIKDTCAPIGTRMSLHASCHILISNETQLATLVTVHTCHHLNIPGAPVGTKLLLHVSWYIMISFTNTQPTVTRESQLKVQSLCYFLCLPDVKPLSYITCSFSSTGHFTRMSVQIFI